MIAQRGSDERRRPPGVKTSRAGEAGAWLRVLRGEKRKNLLSVGFLVGAGRFELPTSRSRTVSERSTVIWGVIYKELV
jgi:hypothetical protein